MLYIALLGNKIVTQTAIVEVILDEDTETVAKNILTKDAVIATATAIDKNS